MNSKINYPDYQRPASINAATAVGLELGSAAILSSNSSSQNAVHLRRALSVMFPHSYIRLYHQPPHSVCSLFSFKQVVLPTRRMGYESDCNGKGNENYSCNNEVQAGHHISNKRHTSWSTLVNVRLKPSSEPSSRVQVLRLQDELEKSLVAHQAKPVGLCPVRRAIYDQCFDEIIREVTVGCIERGLLLFKIRNELRMTVNSYRRLYESAIGYEVGKLVGANLQQVCNDSNPKVSLRSGVVQRPEIFVVVELPINKVRISLGHDQQATADKSNSHEFERTNLTAFDGSCHQSDREVSRLREYYEGELAKKDEIIRQQRAMMRALNLSSSHLRG